MKNIVKYILRKMNLQVKRYPDLDIRRRIDMMNKYGIDLIFDVGANSGQYVTNLRELGYSKKTISFEPINSVFEELQKAGKNDSLWITENFAIGNSNEESEINIAGNSYSSSILPMLDMCSENEPNSKYISQQKIRIKTLDSIYDLYASPEDKVMLKIDTQGYEKNVLEGAGESINKIAIIQLEMSLVPLYENEVLFIDMINYLKDKNFELYSLENGFANLETGQLLQVDGIFVNKNIKACN